jgi:hypothetical protein
MFLGQELILLSNHVVLFAPIHYVNRIKETSEIIKYPDLVDFNSKTNMNNWVSGEKPLWYEKIQDLDNFDIVVSDNLPEVLEIRNDAWLSGSFFWHEIIQEYPLNLKNYYRDLLVKNKPKMISTSYFSQNYLRDYTELFEVGIYGNRLISSNQSRSDILISCGMGGGIQEEAKIFIDNLIKLKTVPFKRVWVEPDIYPIDAPNWMFKAIYTADMFDKLVASIIRPGVGTVSESLLSGVKIFTFFEADNLEMQQNVCFLEEYELGVNSKTIQQAWLDSILYLKNKKQQDFFLQKLKKIEFNGEKKAAQVLLN